jgi:hypothetical protein
LSQDILLNVGPIYGAQLEEKLNLLEGTRISLDQYNFFLVMVGLALLTYVPLKLVCQTTQEAFLFTTNWRHIHTM